MQCKDCMYKQTRKHLKDGNLECRRSSPSCSSGDTICDQNRAFWPAVRWNDWCGSFEAKELDNNYLQGGTKWES